VTTVTRNSIEELVQIHFLLVLYSAHFLSDFRATKSLWSLRTLFYVVQLTNLSNMIIHDEGDGG
jgi:hypothetical protein